MFERFTDHARHIVVRAQEEARALGHDYIGSEHILLGVIREKGAATQILVRLGADLDRARRQVIATTEHAQTSDNRDPLVQPSTLRQPRGPLTDPSQERAANGGTTPEPPG